MKTNLAKLTALCALLSAFVLGGCANPFISPKAGDAVPEGKGMVSVTPVSPSALGSSPGVTRGEPGAEERARTLIPSAAGFSRYEYWFAKDGGAAAQETATAGVFELDPGSYTVTVKAFAGDGASPAAEGTSGAFTITAGQDAGAVTVVLAAVVAEGEGTLAFTLTYPDNATLESFTLTRLAGSDSIDLKAAGQDDGSGVNGQIFAGTKTGIGAGYWLVRLSLNNGDIYTGKSEVAHIYKGLTTELNWAFDDDDFAAIPVVSGANSGPGTLREAVERANAAWGGTIFIDLPEGDKVITLTSPLPAIAANITIEGNGTTLTQNGFTAAINSQFLYIDSSSVATVRRLHFKGGVGIVGGAIYNTGTLRLESCVFSENQATPANKTSMVAGIVYDTGDITVLGCTFYNNNAGSGAVIYRSGKETVTATGNIFCKNISNNFVVGMSVLGGCNISNTTAILPGSFRPFSGGAADNVLPGTLPEGYPRLDFYGQPIAGGGAAGAVQALADAGTYYRLDYGVNNTLYGTASADPASDLDGYYEAGASVTLTAEPKTSTLWTMAFSHWTVNGVKDETQTGSTFTVAMDGDKTVQAVFTATSNGTITVTSANDEDGSIENTTLRFALANAQDGDRIVLPANATITLTDVLPEVAKGIAIEGNGTTLIRGFSTNSANSQLLRLNIAGKTVRISRLHFRDGRASSGAGGIHCSGGSLVLESCIFSSNNGGAIYSSSNANLTVLGCTFYNNSAATGGVIYAVDGTLALTGNLFAGNVSSGGGAMIGGSATISSGNYNVSDKTAELSGYTGAANDLFSVADIAFPNNNTAYPPSSATGLNILTSLPEGFPATYFNGSERSIPATAGAVKVVTGEAGYYLDCSVNNAAYGTVSADPAPASTNGSYASGTSVTLTANPASIEGYAVLFSHWIVNGTKDEATGNGPLALSMDGHKTVQAVFTRTGGLVTRNDDDASFTTTPGTLRYALVNAADGDTITLNLAGNKTIALTSPLPELAKSITINGNGATLTRDPSYTAVSATSSLLRVSSSSSNASLKISRLHFKGGRVDGQGGAINAASLTLESCIFSDNQASGNNGWGGAITAGNVTVLGCTFYNNTASVRGGAIYSGISLVITGNLFQGNAVDYSGSVAGYNLTSGGYNVSDSSLLSGGNANSADVLGVTDIVVAAPLDPSSAPFSPTRDLKTLTTLPAGFPATYFDGSERTTPATAGAVKGTAASGFYLNYSANNPEYGEVEPSGDSPIAGYYYAGNANVTLTAKPRTMADVNVSFSHWIVNGTEAGSTNPLTLVMGENKTVQAVFTAAFTVTSASDASSSATTPGTLRYALTNASDGATININLAGDKTITLTSPLPAITKSITINGNGATLTQSGFAASATSQLLYISNSAAGVNISRLHFKGGRSGLYGGAIRNTGTLTLESCIFNDNQTANNGIYSIGGAVYASGALTVLGCTFYNNTASYQGGAIYSSGALALTGNLFLGNTALSGGDVVYGVGMTSSGGYNVSDKTDSGYTGNATDLFGVTDIVLATPGDPSSAPFGPTSDLNTLTALPAGFPATYFDGSERTTPATAGAVKGTEASGFYLAYSASNPDYGEVEASGDAPTGGYYANNANVTLTAKPKTMAGVAVSFSHWIVNGADAGSTNPLTLVMNAHKVVQAVFMEGFAVTTSDDASDAATTPGTLRYALTNASDGATININLAGDKTITLTSKLPTITKSITINGNGATLTQSGFVASSTSQLLTIDNSSASVKISRLHFKGGRATSRSGAIRIITGNLTLESCIFSDNQATSSGNAGAISNASGALTVLGCTFYNNTSQRESGAIYISGGNLTLTGNLFLGNTAKSAGKVVANVVYGAVANVTSGGYNVSDTAVGGSTPGAGSGYTAATGDLFGITDITFATSQNPATAPSSSNANLNTLTPSLPAGFPATYFDGTSRDLPATAGAMKAQ